MLPWLASLNACDDDLVAGQVNLLCVNEGVAGPSEARKQNHMFFEFLLFLAHHWHGMALGREREQCRVWLDFLGGGNEPGGSDGNGSC